MAQRYIFHPVSVVQHIDSDLRWVDHDLTGLRNQMQSYEEPRREDPWPWPMTKCDRIILWPLWDHM